MIKLIKIQILPQRRCVIQARDFFRQRDLFYFSAMGIYIK